MEKSAAEFRFLASTLNGGEGDVWADSDAGRPVLLSNQEADVNIIDDDTPYEIPDKETLEAFRNYINDSDDGGEGTTFKLTNNINLEGNADNPWTPIGSSSNPFQGTFDGNNKTISGLYIDSKDSEVGLFGVNAGTISSLNVDGTTKGLGVTPTAGMIAGVNMGMVTGCGSGGSVTAEGNGASRGTVAGGAGGIVGNNMGAVKDCSSTAHVAVTVDGSEANGVEYGAGGIVGATMDIGPIQPTVKNCAFSGDVTGSASGGARIQMIMAGIGGVVGMNLASSGAVTVESCSNSGAVSGSGSGGTMTGVGGIVGLNIADEGTASVKNCLNSGDITGNINGTVSGAGGIVGTNLALDAESASVEDCYSIGTIIGEENAVPGAVVGMNSVETESISSMSGTVTNCYYLAAGNTPGIGSGEEGATEKNAEQFASGEVAYLLQGKQAGQVWGQTVNSGIPELTDSPDKKVYQITGEVEDQDSIVWYSNNKAALPAAPKKAGFAFVGWSRASERTEADFGQGAAVEDDMTVYAVFSLLKPGTGAVTMADYTCGDTSVMPEAKSDTNGTDNVKFTYTVKGQNDYKEAKPTTAGEYTVMAVFAAANGYDEVTATADFRITHKIPSSVNGEVTCGCNSELRLEAEELTQVPDGLSGRYDDVEALTRTLVEQVGTGANYAVYDVKIEIKEGAGDWQDAPEDSIPGSVTVTLPYPAGTNSSYTFTAVHMFAFGANAGKTETPDVTNGDDGITFTVTGLSPVCVGWTAPSSDSHSSYYSVTNPSDFEGGSVMSDLSSAKQGSKITLTVKPDEGYHFGSLTVNDRNGKPVEVTDNGDGTYTFTMPYGKVTVEAEFVKCSSLDFTDLKTDSWYHDGVDYVIVNGMMNGTGTNTFEPNATTTRAMVVTILYRLEKEPAAGTSPFTDVEADQWYTSAVAWAAENGVVNGTSPTTFDPNAPITREQMAAILYRYASFKGYDVTGKADLASYTDAAQISDYAKESMAWANETGLIGGVSATYLQPQGDAIRAQVATILMRFCENVAK